MRETERQREKQSFPPGVDTTCLDSRWGRSDREVLMVCGAFSRGTVGHTHTHTRTYICTLVIHPALFILVLWQVRCAWKQREDKKHEKTDDAQEGKKEREHIVCKHGSVGIQSLYGFTAGSYTTKHWQDTVSLW